MNDLAAALAQLESRFKVRCRSDLETLRGLIAADALHDGRAYQLAHSLAGAGGTFGFPDVSAAAHVVEVELKDDKSPDDARLAALLTALEAAAA
jgi:HPt (histidine-containing phosphotransfer) domain-containing protein